jgi:enoyl-CoA hydratase/carnithine racemase
VNKVLSRRGYVVPLTPRRGLASSSSSGESVTMERNGPVATIILNRPSVKNAIDGETADKLARFAQEFEADDSLRVGVLWGVGNFCAGADLKAIREGKGCKLTVDGNGPLGPSRMLLSKPMIAAVSGAAVAGGLELALWCDMRVMEEDAFFGVFCRNWGVPLIDGGTGIVLNHLYQSVIFANVMRACSAVTAAYWPIACTGYNSYRSRRPF